MNYNFSGISIEALELLSHNRFCDSKAFYEEHKEEIKQGITIPMRQIVLDMTPLMSDIDDKMYLNPTYTVSRIRRDTRYTKDKMLYRENIWLMLRRNKKNFPFAPFFWFEISPEGYCSGIAFWVGKQTQFDELRQLILKKQKTWLNAVKKAEKAGFEWNARESYKKHKIENAPDKLQIYLDAKNMEFIKWSSDLKILNTKDIIDELINGFKDLIPIYEFFIEAYDNMISEGLI